MSVIESFGGPRAAVTWSLLIVSGNPLKSIENVPFRLDDTSGGPAARVLSLQLVRASPSKIT